MKEIKRNPQSSSSERLSPYPSTSPSLKKPTFNYNRKLHDRTYCASTSQHQPKPLKEKLCDNNAQDAYVNTFCGICKKDNHKSNDCYYKKGLVKDGQLPADFKRFHQKKDFYPISLQLVNQSRRRIYT